MKKDLLERDNLSNDFPKRTISGQKRTKILTWFLKYGVIAIVLFFVLLPIYWVIATSLKPGGLIQVWPPSWTFPVTFSSYERAFRLLPIPRLFLNSVIIAVVTIITNIFFCSLAGYTFARVRFKGRDKLFVIILASMMIPPNIRLIPNYLLIQQLGLVNTYAGIVLPITITGFGIFLMRQFFLTIPEELEEAARIDGCTEWGVVFRIALPLTKPAVTSLGLFALVWTLEDFIWPLIITSDPLMRPLPVGITLFIGLVVYDWGPVMAMTTLTILPVVVVYLLAQKYFISGLTAGALKG